jgi:7-keto-8-aminopelargonate synthetase-like enzyme
MLKIMPKNEDAPTKEESEEEIIGSKRQVYKNILSSICANKDYAGYTKTPDPLYGQSADPIVLHKGRKMVQFSSANYLGLANNWQVKLAEIGGVAKYGCAPSASRWVSGLSEPLIQLEDLTAQFQGEEDALAFFTVSLASMGCIDSLVNFPHPLVKFIAKREEKIPKGKIFIDERAHPSLVDASKISQAEIITFKHFNMDHLEEKLEKFGTGSDMIVCDGVCSLDGKLAPLPTIVHLAETYGSLICIDDAHGTGVIGETGKGVWEHYNVQEKIDIKIGSYGKSLGCGMGGFITCDTSLKKYLQVVGHHIMFGGAIPQSKALAMCKAIQLATSQPWRRKAVMENVRILRKNISDIGFELLDGASPIIAIKIGDEKKAKDMESHLRKNGVIVTSFRFPAISRGQAILRITVTANHKKKHINHFIEALKDARDEIM